MNFVEQMVVTTMATTLMTMSLMYWRKAMSIFEAFEPQECEIGSFQEQLVEEQEPEGLLMLFRPPCEEPNR